MEDLDKIGTVLRFYREQKYLTLEETAELICSVRQLSRIENNNSLPNVWTFVRLCDRLEIDYSTVIKNSKNLVSSKDKNNILVKKK
ncbi:helix-turn-helix domain-containing protein [Listeria welshimeri]|nr:helix-turn-helix domain-containing protein [Listeria welshimeri]MBC1744155.1 helix-turn-helix domain-containing protein [Listeria welshimeri]